VSTDLRSPFLALPSAVEAVGADAGVAAHYGNPLGEQRALAAGEAVVDLSHRAVLAVSGPDRLDWLNSFTSQRLDRLEPGVPAETLILDQQGRVEHAIRLLDDGQQSWLLVEREQAEPLTSWLLSMRFMRRVEVSELSDRYATFGTLGDPPLPVAESNGVRLDWRDPWPSIAPGGHQYAAPEGHPSASWSYRELLVERSELASLARSGTPLAGLLALEALRIAAWRPRLATEVDARTLPHELDWLRSAVHLDKGCYRGQETVAKVHNLGRPPRRLVMLQLDGSEITVPAAGDEVLLGEEVVGAITSAAVHYESGPIALAVVKRGTDPAAVLSVRSGEALIAAAQEIVVPPDAGRTVEVPRLPRLGAR